MLKAAVPQLNDLEFWRDERGDFHLRGKYAHWRSRDGWQTEAHFSDGTLRLLGLLWAVLEGKGPLLLEEPELSLHPEVVRYIPQTFARIQRTTGRQIVVSTHSSDLLQDDGIGLDEVFLFIPSREGTSIQHANSSQQIKSLLEGGLSVADAVMPRTRPENAERLSFLAE
jgi:predicted ATPase